MKKIVDNSGFTLVELMITLTISGIIVAAIYSAYTAQQRTYLAQEQVAEMQQNIRAGLMMMTREIRMAGYDLTKSAGAGITTARAGQISFTQDITNNAGTGGGDGDTADAGEEIEFGFTDATSATNYDVGRNGIPDIDTDGALGGGPDGVPDAMPLGRQTGGITGTGSGYQPIADNIQAIEFRYLDSADVDLGDPVPAGSLADIRSIQISILARAGTPDRKFTDTMTYTPASGTAWDLNGAAAGNAPNDNFRRRLMITTVNCRNMGL